MSGTKRVAFLTSPNYKETVREFTGFLDEFEVLKPIFNGMGADLVAVDWREAERGSFDILIPKVVWDYFHHPAEFSSFLRRIIRSKARMQNPAEVVEWNMRKTYLRDLQAKGLPVAPLEVLPQGSAWEIKALENLFPADESLIIKPSISGGGRDTVRLKRGDMRDHAELFDRILSYADLIVQPFCEEVASEGEYSIFFFGSEFSHAILKKPSAGDYRAHQRYGAVNHLYEPSPAEIRQAFAYVQAVGKPLAYARVDVFKREGVFHLIELELIEPYLYFEKAPRGAARKFCAAILTASGSRILKER